MVDEAYTTEQLCAYTTADVGRQKRVFDSKKPQDAPCFPNHSTHRAFIPSLFALRLDKELVVPTTVSDRIAKGYKILIDKKSFSPYQVLSCFRIKSDEWQSSYLSDVVSSQLSSSLSGAKLFVDAIEVRSYYPSGLHDLQLMAKIAFPLHTDRDAARKTLLTPPFLSQQLDVRIHRSHEIVNKIFSSARTCGIPPLLQSANCPSLGSTSVKQLGLATWGDNGEIQARGRG